MLRKRLFFGVSALFLVGIIVVAAQRQSNGPKTPNKTVAPKPAVPAAKTTKGAPVKQAKPSQPTVQAQHPSTPQKADKAPTKETAKAPIKETAKAPIKEIAKAPIKETAKAPIKDIAKAPTKPAKLEKTATSTKTTTGTPTTAELTPVQQKLKQNTNLASKVALRLPPGTDVMAAAAGFKNLGQFVAAANVSNNLQISFTELKAKMMTGMSLGQAIQTVRPLTASPTVEAQRAEYDARGLIAESEREQSTTASPSTVPSATPASTTAKPRVKTKNSAQ
jgi:hypothetical protein